MSRPTVTISSRATAPSSSPPVDTGTAFFAGVTETGTITEAVLCRNMDQWEDEFGTRVTASQIAYDAAETFFNEGGSRLYQSRAYGSGGTEGDDNNETIVDADRVSALTRFTKDLGPGQVAYPGASTAAAHSGLLDHARDNHRVALLDTADTSTVATLTGVAATDRALSTDRYGATFAPWVEIAESTVGGGVRTIPPSPVLAGILARNDADFDNVNQAAAGRFGYSRTAVGLSIAAWSDTDHDTLYDAGVNVLISKNETVRANGFRTLVNPTTEPEWLQFNWARVNMKISAEAELVGDRYLFSQLDGQGLTIGEFGGELTALLLDEYDSGALYGDTPEEAFAVDVGDQVNTAETIADGELHAVLNVRLSPHAETVEIEIVKTSTEESIL